jgi:hypothetical protein
MRSIAIGESDFAYLIENKCLYVDKSLFIKDLIDDPSRVILFTRPRRFGKTLNLSMLRCFFQKKDNRNDSLFSHLKIAQYPKYLEKQNKYPVIYIT